MPTPRRRRASHPSRRTAACLLPVYVSEALERRVLFANSIQLLNETFEFEAGQAFNVLGRVVNEQGQPVAGVSVSAEDGLLQTGRSLGTTTPLGYFALNYSTAQPANAGAGLHMVSMSAAGAAAGIILNAVASDTSSYPIASIPLHARGARQRRERC